MSVQEVGTIHLEDLRVGMAASLTKTIDAETVRGFAEVSEDRNPIHLDDDAGRASRFGECIAHGMLVGSLFSALLGERLPGHGTVYLGQSLRFLAPVPVGATVEATVIVSEVAVERKRAMFTCEAKVDGKLVVTGDATVMAPSRA